MKYFILNKLITYCKLQTLQNTNLALNEITLNEISPETSEIIDQQRTCISSLRSSSAS